MKKARFFVKLVFPFCRLILCTGFDSSCILLHLPLVCWRLELYRSEALKLFKFKLIGILCLVLGAMSSFAGTKLVWENDLPKLRVKSGTTTNDVNPVWMKADQNMASMPESWQRSSESFNTRSYLDYGRNDLVMTMVNGDVNVSNGIRNQRIMELNQPSTTQASVSLSFQVKALDVTANPHLEFRFARINEAGQWVTVSEILELDENNLNGKSQLLATQMDLPELFNAEEATHFEVILRGLEGVVTMDNIRLTGLDNEGRMVGLFGETFAARRGMNDVHRFSEKAGDDAFVMVPVSMDDLMPMERDPRVLVSKGRMDIEVERTMFQSLDAMMKDMPADLNVILSVSLEEDLERLDEDGDVRLAEFGQLVANLSRKDYADRIAGLVYGFGQDGKNLMGANPHTMVRLIGEAAKTFRSNWHGEDVLLGTYYGDLADRYEGWTEMTAQGEFDVPFAQGRPEVDMLIESVETTNFLNPVDLENEARIVLQPLFNQKLWVLRELNLNEMSRDFVSRQHYLGAFVNAGFILEDSMNHRDIDDFFKKEERSVTAKVAGADMTGRPESSAYTVTVGSSFNFWGQYRNVGDQDASFASLSMTSSYGLNNYYSLFTVRPSFFYSRMLSTTYTLNNTGTHSITVCSTASNDVWTLNDCGYGTVYVQPVIVDPPCDPCKPDVRITDISWSPSSPTPGQTVTFTATIRNYGDKATPVGVDVGTGFRINGSYLGAMFVRNNSGQVTNLPAGDSYTGTCNATWTATGTQFSIQAIADDIDRFTESNENNNSRTETGYVSGGLPDVIVNRLWTFPYTVNAGNAVNVYGEIKNQGTGATPVGVDVGFGFRINNVYLGSFFAPSNLDPGDVYYNKSNNNWYPTSSGSYSIFGWADDVNRFNESNENNNTKTVNKTVN